jgi:hypothetical protein
VQAYDAELAGLAGLAYASGTPFVKMTGAGTFALDTNTYLTANQSITLSGDISGTGTTAITTAIGANKITEAMLKAVNSATDEYYLTYESTTGDFEWQTAGGGVSFGTTTQIPFMNAGGTDFLYSAGITYDDTNKALNINAMRAIAVKGASGSENLFLGQSGNFTTTGTNNIFAGYQAGLADVAGANNIAIGYQSLKANTYAGKNVAIGTEALYTQSYANGNSAWDTANVAVGYQALYSNQPTSDTNGYQNTALGYQALYSNTTGSDNIANGFQALYLNTTGSGNTAIGDYSLFYNTTGFGNSANGMNSLYSNTTGDSNTANGVFSLYSNTTGDSNTANGYSALYSNTTGFDNTANGINSLYSNTIGSYNTSNGHEALYSNTTGSDNTAIGFQSLYYNVKGNYNIANGTKALYSNTYASKNVAIGAEALYTQSYANGNVAWDTGNVAVGYQALYSNQPTGNNNGYFNTALGYKAGYNNTTGNNNFYGGLMAGYYTQTGGGNVMLGYEAGKGSTGNSNWYNTFVGYSAGSKITTGGNNLILGSVAGNELTSGGNNILLGYYAGDNLTTGSSNLLIGYNIDAQSATGSNQLSIGNLLFSNGINGTGTTVSTGNLGIGITAPSEKLQVAGNIAPSADDTYSLGTTGLRWSDVFVGPSTVHVGTSATDEATLAYNTSTNIFNIGTDSTTNGDVAFFTDDLYLDKSAGKVGIGTTTPGRVLSVTDASNPQVRLSYNDTNYIDMQTNSTAGLVVTSSSNSVVNQTLKFASVPSAGSAIANLSFAGKSLDATGEWSEVYDSAVNGKIDSISYDESSELIFAVAYSNNNPPTIYRCATSTGCDASGDWSAIFTGSTAGWEDRSIKMVLDSTNHVLYARENGKVRMNRCDIANSTGNCDDASDWTYYDNVAWDYTTLGSMEIDPIGQKLYVASFAKGISYCSLSSGCDDGSDWQKYTISDSNGDVNPTSFVYDTESQALLFAGHVDGSNSYMYRCLSSTNCDASGDWTSSKFYTGSGGSVDDLAFDSANGFIYAATKHGILYQCDASACFSSWNAIALGTQFSETIINSVFYQAGSSTLYAGTTDDGLILTCDPETTSNCATATDWTTNYNFAETAILSIAADTTDNVLYAGSSTNGKIYRKVLSATQYDSTYAAIQSIVSNSVYGTEAGVIAFQTNNSGTLAERIRISADGYLGIGRTDPSYALDVLASGTGVIARFISGNTTGCTLATGGTITCTSDARLKTNVEDVNYGLDTLKQLRPVSFNWLTDEAGKQKSLGFLAQEVESVLPGLVYTNAEGFKELNTVGLIPVLAKSIQEQQKQIALLPTQVAEGNIVFGTTATTLDPETQLPIDTFTERMRIDALGNLGLGTLNPSATLDIAGADLGGGLSGRTLAIGNNTNLLDGSAGALNLINKNGVSGFLWQDASGQLRVGPIAPTGLTDTTGTLLGANTSTRETKQDIMPFVDYQGALKLVTDAPLNYFRYTNEVLGYGTDSELAKTRLGFIADEVSPLFMHGNAIDQVSVNGILIGAVKALKLETDETRALFAIPVVPTVLGTSTTQNEGDESVEEIVTEETIEEDINLDVLGKLTVTGGITISGSAEFVNKVMFAGLVSFAQSVDFTKNVLFRGDVEFAGRPTFNADTAGLAMIKKGAKKVDVVFVKEYRQTPIVNASLLASEKTEEDIFSGTYSFLVSRQTEKGFSIVLSKPAKSDVSFSWVALAVKDPTTAIGAGSEPEPVKNEPETKVLETPKTPPQDGDNGENQPPANEPAPVEPTPVVPIVEQPAEQPVEEIPQPTQPSPEVPIVEITPELPSVPQSQNNEGTKPAVSVESPVV